MIRAEIVGHSLNKQGDELISVLATFPRIILAEVNTHRMLSKNTSSSRAIPFNKMLEAIQSNPFIPIAWQKDHKGMQGSNYLEGGSLTRALVGWENAKEKAIEQAMFMNDNEVTKQICNRLLEPFMWTTMLITGSREGWDNFFNLRCPNYLYEGQYSKNNPAIKPRQYKSKRDWCEEYSWNYSDDPPQVEKPKTELDWLKLNKGQAEIHMMALAECIYDAVNESTPKKLDVNQWHIPFEKFLFYDEDCPIHKCVGSTDWKKAIKISVAMAARTSYTAVGEEKEINYENLIGLHDKLLTQDPPHSSPFEHCARAMSDEEYFTAVKTVQGLNREKAIVRRDLGWCNNLKGFIPYRYFVDNSLSL